MNYELRILAEKAAVMSRKLETHQRDSMEFLSHILNVIKPEMRGGRNLQHEQEIRKTHELLYTNFNGSGNLEDLRGEKKKIRKCILKNENNRV
jgi:hypothetical protein